MAHCYLKSFTLKSQIGLTRQNELFITLKLLYNFTCLFFPFLRFLVESGVSSHHSSPKSSAVAICHGLHEIIRCYAWTESRGPWNRSYIPSAIIKVMVRPYRFIPQLPWIQQLNYKPLIIYRRNLSALEQKNIILQALARMCCAKTTKWSREQQMR